MKDLIYSINISFAVDFSGEPLDIFFDFIYIFKIFIKPITIFTLRPSEIFNLTAIISLSFTSIVANLLGNL
jgi:hypothetical protein